MYLNIFFFFFLYFSFSQPVTNYYQLFDGDDVNILIAYLSVHPSILSEVCLFCYVSLSYLNSIAHIQYFSKVENHWFHEACFREHLKIAKYLYDKNPLVLESEEVF